MSRSPRSRGLSQRIRDQLLFSVVTILVLFLILRLVGVRASVPSLFLSIMLTLALNVGLSAWQERRARSPRQNHPVRGGDIRWREEDR